MRGQQRLTCLVRSNRRAAVAGIAEKVHTGCDGEVSQHIVRRGLLCMGLRSHGPVRAPMLTAVHHRKLLQWARGHRNRTMEQWEKDAWSGTSGFLLHHVDGRGKTWHQDWMDGMLVEAVRWPAGKPGSRCSGGCCFNSYLLAKHHCRPSTALHSSEFPRRQ